MDTIAIKEKIETAFKKYRFVCIIFLVGVFLMLLPTKKSEPLQDTQMTTISQHDNITEELQKMLSCIEGAGKVEVMISIAQGEKTLYQTDLDISGGESGNSRQDTVIITNSDRAEAGLVMRIDPPVYRGAVVICQGADRATVRLAVVEAVASITGLGADKISVLKMK